MAAVGRGRLWARPGVRLVEQILDPSGPPAWGSEGFRPLRDMGSDRVDRIPFKQSAQPLAQPAFHTIGFSV